MQPFTNTINVEDTLPNKPSELICVALADLEACEKDSNYDIDMFRWHVSFNIDKKCHVCFAGVVMAQSLNCNRELNIHPCDFNKSITNKLYALEYFHSGRINEGLKQMGYKNYNIPDEIVETYIRNKTSYNPKRFFIFRKRSFKGDMKRIISILENHGL